jgi:methionyl-tRNA formyltransferase
MATGVVAGLQVAILGASVPCFDLADALTADGCKVCAVVPPRGLLGSGVQRRAATRNLPLLDVGVSINAPTTVAALRALDAELFVNWGHPERFSSEVLAATRRGVLNLHPGEIPGARGLEPVFAAMVEGWPAIIQTAHLMTADFDDGPIIRTRRIGIDDEPYRDVVEERLRDGAVAFYRDAVHAVLDGEIGTIGKGPRRYFGRLKSTDDILPWGETRDAILRRLRALSPFKPGRAFVVGESAPLLFWRAEPSATTPTGAAAGQVVAATSDCIEVASGGGVIRVTQYELPPGFMARHPSSPVGLQLMTGLPDGGADGR